MVRRGAACIIRCAATRMSSPAISRTRFLSRALRRQHVLGAAPAPRMADQSVAEKVLLADDGEVGRLEPLFERDNGERQRARPRRGPPAGGGKADAPVHTLTPDH